MDEEGECFSSEDYRYPKTKNEMKRLLWRVQWRITVSTKRIQMSGFSTRQLQKLGESRTKPQEWYRAFTVLGTDCGQNFY
jgi:hypothetical protein